MSVIWKKVWFDLWGQKTRTLLAVISIAAGVLAVGTIFGMLDQLLSEMDRSHRAVSPAHINILLRNFVDQETANGLADIPGLAGIEPANQITVRYKTGPESAWEIGTLVMRPDYDDQTYDRLVLKEGEWPQDGKIGIERLSRQYYGFDRGEKVIFEINGEERTFEISGLVRHPFVQPPSFGGQAHFFADAATLAGFGIPEGRYGQLLAQVEPYSYENAQEIAGEIRARLGEQGIGVIVTLYQEPDRHWGRMFVEGVNLVLQVMAVVSLLLSAALVLNTMTALIAQQTEQIGTIKAIGGRRSTIVAVYLAEVLVIGLLALAIALPFSAWLAYEISQWFLNLFNIDYPVFRLSWKAAGLSILAALLAPLLAALWPVLKGAAISVREAIATYGIGNDFGSSRIDRAVERVGEKFLPPTFAVSLGNLFRRKGRLVLTLVGLSAAGGMFLVVMSLIASIRLTLDNEMARRRYDVRIGFTQDQPAERVRSLAGQVTGIQAAEIWYSRNALFLREGDRLQDSAGLGAQLIGVPADTQMYQPIITAGRWLVPGDEYAIVINQDTARKNNLQIGETLTLDLGELGEQAWEIIGTYKVVYDTGFVVEPVYAPLETVWEATGQTDIGTQVLVRFPASTLYEATRKSDELSSLYEDQGMKIDFYTTTVKLEEGAFAYNQFSSVISVLLNLAMLMAVVGGIGLAGALGISVVERRREIGVMRAIGARTQTVAGLLMLESLLQGLLSWAITVPLSFLLARPFARLLGQTMLEMDLDFAFHSPAVLLWLAILLVICILASTAPARSAVRVSVRESLTYS